MPELPKTIGRTPVEDELLGVKITVTPLAFGQSQDMLPDVVRFITQASSVIAMVAASGVKGTDDIKKILAFLPRLDAESMGVLMELVNKHAGKLLAPVVVVMPHPISGELENFEMRDLKRRAIVFDERPDLFVPLCVLSGRVTFARFFPEIGQQGGGTPAAES